MHIIVTVHTTITEESLVDIAHLANIRVYGLNGYRTAPIIGEPSFLIGFGGLAVDEITSTVDALMTSWQIEKGAESS